MSLPKTKAAGPPAPAPRLSAAPADAAPAAPPVAAFRGHMPVLDGVRGLAILMVLLLHFIGNATPTNRLESLAVKVFGYGLFGVDLFFVLSGFLITGILFDAREKPNYFRNFYMRRLLRIFPLYYGVLAVLFLVVPLVPWFRGSALAELREHQAWAWLYAVNVYISMKGDWALPYIDHFWSLAVEEHFYFVWPLVVWWLARRPSVLLRVSLAVAVGAMLARIVAHVAGVNHVATTVLTPFRLDGLALGGFLAVAARRPGGPAAIARWTPRVAAAAAAAFLASVAWSRLSDAGLEVLRPTRNALLLVLLACLLLWALTASRESPIARFFTSRTMVFLGTYSYGLYVYHHFLSYYFLTHRTEFEVARWVGSHTVAVLLQAAFAIAVSSGVAWASYHLFEKHFLKLKSRFESAR